MHHTDCDNISYILLHLALGLHFAPAIFRITLVVSHCLSPGRASTGCRVTTCATFQTWCHFEFGIQPVNIKMLLINIFSVYLKWVTPKLSPGPEAVSWMIANTCLYYFFNIICLCEPISSLSVRIGQTCYVYMEHVV